MSSLDTFRRITTSDGSFSDLSDDEVSIWLGLAADLHNSDRWGSAYTLAMCLYAAHMVKQFTDEDSNTAAGGPLSSAKTGGLAESYATSAPNPDDPDSDLRETKYGRRYLAIRSTRPKIAGPRIVRVTE